MPFPPMNPHVKHSVPAIVSCAVVALAWASPPGGNGAKEIDEKTVRTHVEFLAAPGLEGRDTPSEGLRRAARYIADRFGEFGLLPASDSVEVLQREGAEFGYDDAGEDALPGFLRPYRIRHEAPVPEDCFLALDVAASNLLSDDRYHLPRDGHVLSAPDMVDFYQDLVSSFPVVSIEDGLGEEDWTHVACLRRRRSYLPPCRSPR